ncbi:MAG: T9SS C-terminal target domain-containing protein, partial [Flavobacteriales bacterium TMED191]
IELNNENACFTDIILLINSSNESFSWEGSGGIIGELDEFELCNADWCIESFAYDPNYSEIYLSFINEGTYVLNTFINECPELTNTITFNVVENCSSANLETHLNFQMFLDANNNLNINNLEQPSSLEIYNTIGKKLIESNINKKNNLIQLNQYSKGIYTIQIHNENSSFSKKIYIN